MCKRKREEKQRPLLLPLVHLRRSGLIRRCVNVAAHLCRWSWHHFITERRHLYDDTNKAEGTYDSEHHDYDYGACVQLSGLHQFRQEVGWENSGVVLDKDCQLNERPSAARLFRQAKSYPSRPYQGSQVVHAIGVDACVVVSELVQSIA